MVLGVRWAQNMQASSPKVSKKNQHKIKIDTKSTKTLRTPQQLIENQQASNPNQAKCDFGLVFVVAGRRVGARMPTPVGCSPRVSPLWLKITAQWLILGTIVEPTSTKNRTTNHTNIDVEKLPKTDDKMMQQS